MYRDPVVEEVRKFREAWAAKFGYNVRAIVEDARKRLDADGNPILVPPPPPKRARKAVARHAAGGDECNSQASPLEDQATINRGNKPPYLDPILEEVYRIRDELAAKFNYNIRAMVEDMRKREAASGHPVLPPPPPRPKRARKATPRRVRARTRSR